MRHDTIVTRVDIQYDWKDRLRILLGRSAHVLVRTPVDILDPADLLPGEIECAMRGEPPPTRLPLHPQKGETTVWVEPVFPERRRGYGVVEASASGTGLAQAVTKDW